ncbi:MAG TPA: PaaI family thioesterase [Hyphomicrobiaceae bacterium]|nr:PaaI family thioesterase [Hyphomicrobiaceae bacterium]
MSTAKSWTFGNAPAEEIARLTGRGLLEAIISGRLPQPPICETLGFALVEVGEGTAAFEGEPSARLLNPLGAVHGGWLLTLVDSAGGCAAHSTIPPGVGFGTIETKANFSRPIRPDSGLVRAEGRVVGRGRQIISTDVRVTDAAGRLLGHGTSTLMVLAPRA